MRVCSICGKENPAEGKYCSFCGRVLTTDSTGVVQSAAEAAEYSRKDILNSIGLRRSTDRSITPLWCILSLLIVVPTSGLFIISILAIFLHFNYGEGDLWNSFYGVGRNFFSALFGVLLGVLVFKLLSRLNAHIDREERLRSAVMRYLMSSSGAGTTDPEMMRNLVSASAFDGQALSYEKKLPPRTWAWRIAVVFVLGSILSAAEWAVMYYNDDAFDSFGLIVVLSYGMYIIILIGLIMLLSLTSTLMKTMYTHEERWIGFMNSTGVALRNLGKKFEPSVDAGSRKERPFVLYAALTIITFGLFGIYWLYTLIDDPNKHFERQHVVEDALAKAVS
jgi:energy-coupling factor transporter transmembrane protein EcfT